MRRPARATRSRGGPVAAVRLLGGAVLAAGTVWMLRGALRATSARLAGPAHDHRLRSQWTSVRGIAGAGPLRLRARVGGVAGSARVPVVLVPGWGVGSSYLRPLAVRLAKHLRVHVLEPPGHGRSDHDARPLTIPELALSIAAWMDAVGLRAALLVGHSLGCQVVAEVAATRRDLVAGLVLVGPTSDPEVRTPARQIARGAVASLFDRPSYLLRAGRDYLYAGPRLLRAEMRQMVTHRIEAVLPLSDAPARVVRGGRDRVVPQPWAETVARLAGAPPPTVVPGWGHAVHYADADAVARVVLDLAHGLGAADRRGGSARLR